MIVSKFDYPLIYGFILKIDRNISNNTIDFVSCSIKDVINIATKSNGSYTDHCSFWGKTKSQNQNNDLMNLIQIIQEIHGIQIEQKEMNGLFLQNNHFTHL